MGEGDEARDGTGDSGDPLLAAVGRKVRDAREAAGLGVVEAARRTGVAKGYYHRVETGQQNLSLRSVARLAAGLGTTMSALLEGVAVDPDAIGRRPYRWKAGQDVRPKPSGRAAKAGGATGVQGGRGRKVEADRSEPAE